MIWSMSVKTALENLGKQSLGRLCNWAGDEGWISVMLCVNLCPFCSILQINLLSMEHNFDMVSVVL